MFTLNKTKMKLKFLLQTFIMASAVVFLDACKDDDPPPKTTINFEKDKISVNESDGTSSALHPDILTGSTGTLVTVNLTLDRPLSKEAVLAYTVAGTATSVNPLGSGVNDYVLEAGENVTLNSSTITIAKGASSASIGVRIYDDLIFELYNDLSYKETVELTLTSITSGPIQLGTTLKSTVEIQEDDALISLAWDPQDDDKNNDPGDVDLDLWAFLGDDYLTYSYNEGAKDAQGNANYELIYIPSAFRSDTYSLSFPYYSGTSDNVKLYVDFWGYINDKFYPYFGNDAVEFTATYTKNNINKYTDVRDQDNSPEDNPAVAKVQTLTKDKLYFKNISQIKVPDSKSRAGATAEYYPSLLKKHGINLKLDKTRFQNLHKSFLK
jgi:hypothetical protein